MDLNEAQIEEQFRGDGKEYVKPVLASEEAVKERERNPEEVEKEEIQKAIKEIDEKTDEASGANYIPSETIELVKKYKKP